MPTLDGESLPQQLLAVRVVAAGVGDGGHRVQQRGDRRVLVALRGARNRERLADERFRFFVVVACAQHENAVAAERFSHVRMDYTEAAVLQHPIVVGGRSFNLAANATADLEWDLWRLGYAKHSRACHVYVDDGVHVAIEPFTGEVAHAPTGDATADALHELRERSWDALRDWPFYAGGGVGFACC